MSTLLAPVAPTAPPLSSSVTAHLSPLPRRPPTTPAAADADRSRPAPAATGAPRVVVCHPERLLAEVIAAALRATGRTDVVGAVTSASELLTRRHAAATVALVSDAVGPDLFELLEAMELRRSPLRLVVLAADDDPRRAAEAIERGAVGSVAASAPVPALEAFIDTAHRGGVALAPDRWDDVAACLHDLFTEGVRARTTLQRLSTRERRVLESLADGIGVVEIARTMCLSPHTIRACIRGLGARLGTPGQLRIAAAARELLQAARMPSLTFLDRNGAVARLVRDEELLG